jgi:hypothetical protein
LVEVPRVLFIASLLQDSASRVDHERYGWPVGVVADAVPLVLGDEHRIDLSFGGTGSPPERARHEPSSTYIISSALGCWCSTCTLPGGISEESKMNPRAPASSLLITFLKIKPSWSGVVITSVAASQMFLIFSVLLSFSIASALARQL